MFIAFEGIDGCGKTTLSSRVAKKLRDDGYRVVHVREDGRFSSRTAQAMRDFARDPLHLELHPEAELLLYAAREAQSLEEITRPALSQAHVVIADRFLYTPEVLAIHGRGLPESRVRALLRSVSRGLEPDLAILVDVDPHLARARRRAQKIKEPSARGGSRKGLAGAGLQHRLREGYLALAAADPARWAVVDNDDTDLDLLVARMVDVVRNALHAGVPLGLRLASQLRTTRLRIVRPVGTDDAFAAFLDWIDRRSEREPDVAAYFLSGLAGPGVDARRRTLALRAPAVSAFGTAGLDDPLSRRIREALAPVVPRQVARSLSGESGATEPAWQLRDSLVERAPEEVLGSLAGRDDERSWALRERLAGIAPDAALRSLARLTGERAWEHRRRYLEEDGSPRVTEPWIAPALCESVRAIDDPRAWRVREAALPIAPAEVLRSIAGLSGDRAWALRERFADGAPRLVLRGIDGIDDPRAWRLRRRCVAQAKEAIDSIAGMDGSQAWSLRMEGLDRWPSTVVKSLGVLAGGSKGQAIVARQLSRYPQNLSLLRHVAALVLSRPTSAAAPEART